MSSISGDVRTQVPRDDRATFQAFVASVRAVIDARLSRWLDARVGEALARGGEVGAVAAAVRDLVLRGGKRMRAVLLAASYHGYDGAGGVDAVAPAGASMELLQAYLLAHDDWMDGDDLRRGGPSVPAMMRQQFGNQGAAASVLAGDLAAAWALSSMLELAVPPDRLALAMQELARVEAEVVQGQVLDVCTTPGEAAAVEAAYALKTASYTVTGPIVIGARLAGAGDAEVAELVAFAEPLGVAFQLRDDILDLVGGARSTGRPPGNDLRKGKRTSVIVEALREPATRRLIDGVFGRADASEAEVAVAVKDLMQSDARDRVEERIESLVRQSLGALERAGLNASGRGLLSQAVLVLTERDR